VAHGVGYELRFSWLLLLISLHRGGTLPAKRVESWRLLLLLLGCLLIGGLLRRCLHLVEFKDVELGSGCVLGGVITCTGQQVVKIEAGSGLLLCLLSRSRVEIEVEVGLLLVLFLCCGLCSIVVDKGGGDR